ncbi:MAG TPA: GNAT family N-acetyltransferase [Arenimonas sp.]|nr:GNAT family N-acetyltransferase [Arenimonas sp.]
MIARLRGPRLDLRPLAEGDQALYVQLYGDALAMQHIGAAQDAGTATRGFHAALRHHAAVPPDRYFWVIHDRELAQPLGLIGLSVDEPAGAEVGVLLPASQQGRGIATEAIATLADHAFACLRLQRLHTRHLPGHALAVGLMATLGFEPIAPDSSSGHRRWQLTPDRWATSPRRLSGANRLT